MLYILCMNKKDVVKYFGTQSRVGKQLGLTRQAIGLWPEKIPPYWALKLDKMTKEDLLFDKTDYQ